MYIIKKNTSAGNQKMFCFLNAVVPGYPSPRDTLSILFSLARLCRPREQDNIAFHPVNLSIIYCFGR
jgi:hypothetical protein